MLQKYGSVHGGLSVDLIPLRRNPVGFNSNQGTGDSCRLAQSQHCDPLCDIDFGIIGPLYDAGPYTRQLP